jgi:hypothetical protein
LSNTQPPLIPVAKLGSDIEKLLRQAFGDRLQKGLKKKGPGWCFVADNSYICPSLAEVSEMVASCPKSKRKFVPELFDCDDFSWRMRTYISDQASQHDEMTGYPFGIIWRGPDADGKNAHAYNWVVTSDHGVQMVLPQAQTVRPINDEDRRIYLVCC